MSIDSETVAQRTFAAVREANRSTRNAVEASSTGTRNAVRSASASTRASVCVARITRTESVQVSSDLSARAVRGEAPAFAEEAQALLRARHDAIYAREQEFASRVHEADVARQAEIDSNSEDVR